MCVSKLLQEISDTLLVGPSTARYSYVFLSMNIQVLEMEYKFDYKLVQGLLKVLCMFCAFFVTLTFHIDWIWIECQKKRRFIFKNKNRKKSSEQKWRAALTSTGPEQGFPCVVNAHREKSVFITGNPCSHCREPVFITDNSL